MGLLCALAEPAATVNSSSAARSAKKTRQNLMGVSSFVNLPGCSIESARGEFPSFGTQSSPSYFSIPCYKILAICNIHVQGPSKDTWNNALVPRWIGLGQEKAGKGIRQIW